MDSEHRQQHRPYACASGHAEVSSQSGNERGDVSWNSCRTIAMLCGNRLTMVSRTAGTSLFVIARQGVVETTPQLERLCQD
ncbi:hypothetical protein BIFCAT_00819 [Bifidobacterium catenulatum DSM 16992 = JCM 1194 = LMG 11043]|uniref:Uncharacterized protein n=1 Tax=Bifidobacterium catenulatum DSM 16992 = JCM 1194 = LMG 11043 TaxID=566552 RepID=B6XU65_9BIFI|nr:hypothetical protein BIFCAT_00819 [Bifidobacterium catenulatum DSM 16992 = JCM 1194 = LMG 11043]